MLIEPQPPTVSFFPRRAQQYCWIVPRDRYKFDGSEESVFTRLWSSRTILAGFSVATSLDDVSGDERSAAIQMLSVRIAFFVVAFGEPTWCP